MKHEPKSTEGVDMRVTAITVVLVTMATVPLLVHAEWKRVPSSGKQLEIVVVKHPRSEAIRKKGRGLYATLNKIKKEPDFINNGYGSSPSQARYKKYDEEAIALNKDCLASLDRLTVSDKVQSELLDICSAANHLHSLGVHYAMNGAVDDRPALVWVRAIKAAFRIK